MIDVDDRAAAVRRLVARHLGVSAPRRVVALGHGTDHDCHVVDDWLVVRCQLAGTVEADVEREAQLLALVAEVSPLPVPRPVFVAPHDGCLAYEWIDGVALLDVPPRDGEAVAAQLGSLLRALHDVDTDRVAGLVELDQVASEDLVREARMHYDAVSGVVPPRERPAVEAFLAAAAPPAAGAPAFSHNDLGIEHVLVDPGTTTVSGVIDWSDAALADPARDFGLIHRDLGPKALDAALSAFGLRPGEDEAFRARALFHARCALLEDLAFGLDNRRPAYVNKSLAGLSWLFAR